MISKFLAELFRFEFGTIFAQFLNQSLNPAICSGHKFEHGITPFFAYVEICSLLLSSSVYIPNGVLNL